MHRSTVFQRGGYRGQKLAIHFVRNGIYQCAAGFRLGGQFGHFVRQRLESNNRLAELLAGAQIRDGFVQRALRNTHGLRGYARAGIVQRFLQIQKAAALAAQQIGFGHAHVFKNQLVRRVGANPHFLLFFTKRKAGGALFND